MKNVKLYSKKSLESIQTSNFLTKEDLQAIKQMQLELQDTFEKKQIWRTATEIEISVLNDISFPTKAAKYWQCIREQSVFFENLVTLSFEYRRILLKIARLKEELKKTEDEFDREEIIIDIEEAEFGKKNMEVQAKDRARELKIWSKKKAELNDGSFDDKNVDSHQLISYTQSFLNKLFTMDTQLSSDEVINLKSHIQTSLRVCKERNILDKVLIAFDAEQQKFITEAILNFK